MAGACAESEWLSEETWAAGSSAVWLNGLRNWRGTDYEEIGAGVEPVTGLDRPAT